MCNEVAVVIPYYHKDLLETEKISLKQCLKILSEYPIILVIPDNMEEPTYQYKNVSYERVPAEWLISVATYNQMMLKKSFYERFKKYNYILIYQLDAFVFSNQLNRFCQYGFDYIGAPWLKGVKYYKDFSRCVWHVGNGGLSLRKVASFINILNHIDLSNGNVIEDVFWSSCEGENFCIAPVDVALQFAFECDVRVCHSLNGKKIPFGCHAWEKYDYDFWKPYIENEGYKLTTKNKDVLEEGRDYRYLEMDSAIVRKSCEQYLRCEDKEIYIWGAGIWGEECGWLLKKCGMDKFHYLDTSRIKQGEYLWDVCIEEPETLMKQKDKDHIVIIAIKRKRKEILEFLENKGYCYQQNVFLYMDWIKSFTDF